MRGPNAVFIAPGGGSGSVTPFSSVSVSDGLKRLKGKDVVLLTDDVIFENIADGFYADPAFTEKGLIADNYKNKNLQ